MSGQGIERIIFEVSSALRIPVLVLTLLAFAAVLVELGYTASEMFRRRRRSFERLEGAAESARNALARRDPATAVDQLRRVSWSDRMTDTLELLVTFQGAPHEEERSTKALADFDYRSLRRLERARILVRVGPALGLMGTLIPLSPALAALAQGNVALLSENLRVAFSVTILGLMIGALAFAISMVRDRMYSQDLSDLEYVAATLEQPSVVKLHETTPVAVDPPRAPVARSPDGLHRVEPATTVHLPEAPA